MKNTLIIKGIDFDEKAHIYRVDGITLPSVTQIMEPLSIKEYQDIDASTLQSAAHKGTAVHNGIENWMKYGISGLEDEFEGYFNGFKEWYTHYQPEVLGSEIRLYHKVMMYSGTADMVANIDGEMNLIDFKTTYRILEKNCRVQLEAYAQALVNHGYNIQKKRIINLKKDGTYVEKVFPAYDLEAWRAFSALKTIYDYAQK